MVHVIPADLNPCDFYLWGYLKSVVYSAESQSSLPWRSSSPRATCIRRQIRRIKEETLAKVSVYDNVSSEIAESDADGWEWGLD